jgi:uncharacterized protein involved in cysteine biosynthesis
MSAGSGIVVGFSTAMRGLKLATASKDVRATYVQLVLVLLAVSTVLDVAGIWAVWHWTGSDPGDAWWQVLAMVLLRIAGIGIVLLAAPVLALRVVDLVFPLLGERVFLAALRLVAPARAEQLAAAPGLPLSTSIANSIVRTLSFFAQSVGVFALSFVPVAGAVIGPLLQAYLTARALSWELLEPYFDKLALDRKGQARVLDEHRTVTIGFALPFVFVMAIPIVGPLVYGLAQGAAALLVADVLESGGSVGSHGT